MSQHCNKEYHRKPNKDLKIFADGVETGYYGNGATFPVLPIPQVDFHALIEDYDDKLSDYEKGGDEQKGPFLISKAALIDVLDLLATETDKVAVGNAAIIILAGFEPTKIKGETVKPIQCVAEVKRGIAGELIPSCEKIDNAKHYGCIMTEGAPLSDTSIIDSDGRLIWTITPGVPPVIPFASIQIDFTDQPVKHFLNLKHDVTYYFYFFAVNSAGVGPVSEVVSMVCW